MQAVALFKSYFGGAFDEDAIRNNFVLIYELLDGKQLKATRLLGLLAFTPPHLFFGNFMKSTLLLFVLWGYFACHYPANEKLDQICFSEL
jgi:hypothetical protein